MEPAAAFAALGNPSRLAIFRLLARRAPAGVPAGEIAAALGMKPNVASVYLATLARAGLIAGRRDGKQILYALERPAAGALIDYLALDCCRGRPELCAPLTTTLVRRPRAGRPFGVLFVCTGNAARSIMAEALLRRAGGGRFRVFSGGMRPAEAVHPRALALLARERLPTDGLRPKSAEAFRGPDAPALDAVVTVCDRAADEDCPPWPGAPLCAHWGVPAPTRAPEAAQDGAFADAFRLIERHVAAFAALPVERLDAAALQAALDRIAIHAPV